MKALIFGITGQDGFYLKQILEKRGIEVFGASRQASHDFVGNISNFTFVENIIKNLAPDFIFHLAANSTTEHSALFDNYNTISSGTLNILEAVYQHHKTCKVFISGSAVQFENRDKPINESTPFSACSAYALTRIQSVESARYYRNLGISVYVGYFFHHDSPLRSSKHLSKKIVDHIKKIKEGHGEIMKIGNWDIEKEYNFAGDMMEAVWILINQNQFFESVIGSGKTYSIKHWIEICAAEAGVDNVWQFFEKNEKFQAPFKKIVSDPTLIKSLGWEPKTNIEQLAKLMVN